MPDVIASLEIFIKCRTCLNEINGQSTFTSLNSILTVGENIETTISNMIQLLTNIEISENDNYSQVICGDCFEKATNAFIFRIQCITTDVILKNTFNVRSSTPKPLGNDNVLCDSSHLKDISHLSEHLHNLENEEDDLTQKTEQISISRHLSLNDSMINQSFIANLNSKPNKETIQTETVKFSNEKRNKKSVPANVFVCDICGKNFKYKNVLNRHILKHSNKCVYICPVCSKAFCLLDDLKKHSLTHGDKKFTCEVCASSFTRKDSLNIHKKIHLNIKPYSCLHCDKRFLNKYNLQNHVRIHSNEAPYKCSLCSKSFRQRTSLQRHLRVHKRKTASIKYK